MSEEKKPDNNPGEEPVKLNMSFEDAIRLAGKTAPVYYIDLPLNEQVEIKNVGGKKVDLSSIEIVHSSKDLSFYVLTIRLFQIDQNEEYEIKKSEIRFANLNAINNFNKVTWNQKSREFIVADNQKLWAILTPIIDTVKDGKAKLLFQVKLN
jgi:hypothetical protein